MFISVYILWTGLPLIACRYRVEVIASIYSIHTNVMSDVALENTRDIKCIF